MTDGFQPSEEWVKANAVMEFVRGTTEDVAEMKRGAWPGMPEDPTAAVDLDQLHVFGVPASKGDSLSQAIADQFVKHGVLRENAAEFLGALIQGRVNLERRGIAQKLRAKAELAQRQADHAATTLAKGATGVIADALGEAAAAVERDEL